MTMKIFHDYENISSLRSSRPMRAKPGDVSHLEGHLLDEVTPTALKYPPCLGFAGESLSRAEVSLCGHVVGGGAAHGGGGHLGEGPGGQFVLDVGRGGGHQRPEEPAHVTTAKELVEVLVSALQPPLAHHVCHHGLRHPTQDSKS